MISIRVLLCDDHTLFRTGIVSILRDEPGIFVVGEAADGFELIKKYELLKPDVIIADISMPGLSGTDAVSELKLKYPNIRVLFLTMLTGEQYVYYAIKVGGLGLVNKTVEKGELVFAINEVFHERNYFGTLYNQEKIKEILKKYENLPVHMDLELKEGLSETEDKILLLISEGMTSLEIADAIHLSKKTIDSYRIKLMKKFDLPNSSSLIRFALRYSESKQ
ncbi:MAG: response regulator transcription factor [Ignavibacteriaceae bacterium]|nr:response regulator transcription factor [Ignavibacteriaceae bacterium]